MIRGRTDSLGLSVPSVEQVDKPWTVSCLKRCTLSPPSLPLSFCTSQSPVPVSSLGQHISPNEGFFMWGWGSCLLISYSREQGQTTPRLTHSAWGRAEASVNNKGKQEKGKTESSGWKPDHMKEEENKSLNILIKNERRWSAEQGQRSSAQSGLINCGDFGHRSLETKCSALPEHH